MISLQEILAFKVLVWVVPSALVFVAIGVLLGRELGVRNMTKRLRRERSVLGGVMRAMMDCTEQMHLDVEVHNSDLTSVQEGVIGGEYGSLEPIQAVLIEKITAVVAANKKLEDDLIVTRYRLDEQAQMLDSSMREARTDTLSGLGNRKSFDESMRYATSAFKSQGTPFALVMADIDYFKRINDTHGHQAGDEVVGGIGAALMQLCREHDSIARYGGDEFAIVLMNVNREAAQAAASRIRTAIEQTNFSVGNNDGKVSVTFSMGMAFPQLRDTAESIIARADQALYESKRQGRNQLQIAADPIDPANASAEENKEGNPSNTAKADTSEGHSQATSLA